MSAWLAFCGFVSVRGTGAPTRVVIVVLPSPCRDVVFIFDWFVAALTIDRPTNGHRWGQTINGEMGKKKTTEKNDLPITSSSASVLITGNSTGLHVFFSHLECVFFCRKWCNLELGCEALKLKPEFPVDFRGGRVKQVVKE